MNTLRVRLLSVFPPAPEQIGSAFATGLNKRSLKLHRVAKQTDEITLRRNAIVGLMKWKITEFMLSVLL